MYPQLSGQITYPNPNFRARVDPSGAMLTKLGQIRNITIHPTESKYWKRYKIDELTTIGSVISQRNVDRNHLDHYICYTSSDELGACNFGSIQTFLIAPWGQEYAFLRQWTGVDFDPMIHQITSASEDRDWVLIELIYIMCVVGVQEERDLQINGRVLRQIVGPLIVRQTLLEKGLATS